MVGALSSVRQCNVRSTAKSEVGSPLAMASSRPAASALSTPKTVDMIYPVHFNSCPRHLYSRSVTIWLFFVEAL
jgi:hypothetical protein